MSQGLILLQNKVKDLDSRENFTRIKVFLRDTPILKADFKFFEITIPAAVTALKYAHNLTYIPKDVITSAVSNNQTVTWLYDNFDFTNVVLTVSGPCKIRVFLGTYTETL